MGSGGAPTASSVVPRRAAGVTAGGRRSASEVVAPLDLRDHVAELVDVRLKRGKQTGNRRPPSISLAALDVGEGGGVRASAGRNVVLGHVSALADQPQRFPENATVTPISRSQTSFSVVGHQ
jgi:hypothetical protein